MRLWRVEGGRDFEGVTAACRWLGGVGQGGGGDLSGPAHG